MTSEEAEQKINGYAREKGDDLELAYTKHVKERCEKRDVFTPDILHVLAYGYIEGEPEESTRQGYYKYKICNRTPNSGNREMCLVVVPDPNRPAIKIITAMLEGFKMTPEIKRYHYTECGLSNVWIQGLCVEDDAGEETIRIPKIGSLHKLISKGIVTSKGTLTGPELRYLRTEMGLTQTQMGELVHRERVTVSRWENEESTLDGATEAYIRLLASSKLDLDAIDPEKVSGWCKLTPEKKEPICIDATDPDNYRLAA